MPLKSNLDDDRHDLTRLQKKQFIQKPKAKPLFEKVFLICVGNDKYEHLPDMKYCKSDAIKFQTFITKSLGDGVEVDTQGIYDEEVSIQKITEAFEHVVREAKAKDLTILYYSGHSIADNEFCGLLMPDAAPGDPSNILSAPILKDILSRLESKQLLIFDSDCGDDFFDKFLAQVIDSDPLMLEMASKNRFLIGVRDISFESRKHGGGTLTHIIESVYKKKGVSIIDLFDSAKQKYIQAHLQLQDAEVVKDLPSTIQPPYHILLNEAEIVHHIKLMYSPLTTLRDEIPILVPPQSTGELNENPSYALIIGTDEYEAEGWGNLNNPRFDAETIGRELETRYAIETEYVFNPTKKEMMHAIARYTHYEFGEQSQLLIFIAGHGGHSPMARGYLVPKDVRDDDWACESVLWHSQLRDMINFLPCPHIMIVIDACFGGTFDQEIDAGTAQNMVEVDTKNVTITEILSQKYVNKTRLYLTSGGKEYVPDGRPGRHSPFAFRFLEALRSNGGTNKHLNFQDILRFVENAKPGPRAGEFGQHEPGGDFLLIHQPGKEARKKVLKEKPSPVRNLFKTFLDNIGLDLK